MAEPSTARSESQNYTASLSAKEEALCAIVRSKIELAIRNQFPQNPSELVKILVSRTEGKNGYTLSIEAKTKELSKDPFAPKPITEELKKLQAFETPSFKPEALRKNEAGNQIVTCHANTIANLIIALNRAILNVSTAIDPAPYANQSRV